MELMATVEELTTEVESLKVERSNNETSRS